MNKRSSLKGLLILFLLILSLSPLYASSGVYVVRELDMNVEVGRNAVHHVQEDYSMYFLQPSHGFYRDIPVDYSDSEIHAYVNNLKCSDPFVSAYDGGYLTMKIGQSDVIVRGNKDYTIVYDYDLGADNNEGYDEFYFNLVGPGWDARFETVNFTVTVPYTGSDLKYYLTSGRYGNTVYSGTVSATVSGDNTIIQGSINDLDAGDSLTVRVELPDNWYQGARVAWDHRDVWIYTTYGICLVLVVLAVLVWRKYGKDRTLIVTARFKAPDGFTPLAAGYVADGNVDNKDITSMIYYWADRGLLRIEEPRKNSFEFVRLKDIGEDSPEYEKRLFRAFFRRMDEEGRVTFKDLRNSGFSSAMASAASDTKSYFSNERKLTDTRSSVFEGIFTFVSLIPGFLGMISLTRSEFAPDSAFSLVVGAFLLPLVLGFLFRVLFSKWYLRKTNVPFIIFMGIIVVIDVFIRTFIMTAVYERCPVSYPGVIVLSTAAISLFAAIMPRKSEYGHKVTEELLGFREFIDKVEVEKLKTMIDSDPKLYYRVLCYAIVFGLENKWASKFSGLQMQEPGWYSGISPFDVMMLAHLNSRLRNSMMNSIAPSSGPSGGMPRVGGGGFHSSGFSGGGFGGGGGRAW